MQAIIESTPELDMDLEGCQVTRYRRDLKRLKNIVIMTILLPPHKSYLSSSQHTN